MTGHNAESFAETVFSLTEAQDRIERRQMAKACPSCGRPWSDHSQHEVRLCLDRMAAEKGRLTV